MNGNLWNEICICGNTPQRGDTMVRGISKQVVVVEGNSGDFYENAFFILKEKYKPFFIISPVKYYGEITIHITIYSTINKQNNQYKGKKRGCN